MSLFCFLNIKVIKRWQKKKKTFKWNRVFQNLPQPNLNPPVKAAATVRGGELIQAEDWRRASVPSNRTEPNRTAPRRERRMLEAGFADNNEVFRAAQTNTTACACPRAGVNNDLQIV